MSQNSLKTRPVAKDGLTWKHRAPGLYTAHALGLEFVVERRQPSDWILRQFEAGQLVRWDPFRRLTTAQTEAQRTAYVREEILTDQQPSHRP